MSSRIFRGEPALEAELMQWKHTGGQAIAPSRQVAGAKLVAADNAGDGPSQQEVAALLDQARTKALAEGEAAGAKKAAAKLEPAVAAFRTMAEQLASQTQTLRAQAEEDLVKLAIAIARRVLNRELTTDPEVILGLVKAAGAKLNAREIRRLRLSPAFFTVVAAHRGALDLPPGLAIESDESLPANSVVFETTRGEVDASIQTQLAEIERGLADVVRRQAAR